MEMKSGTTPATKPAKIAAPTGGKSQGLYGCSPVGKAPGSPVTGFSGGEKPAKVKV